MVRRTPLLLSTAGAFALLLAVGAQTADARLSCGDTVKADTKLTRDLVNCPNNGIVIGADNITLDLNGHSVAGDGELVESCPRNKPCDIGVVSSGHDGVTVTRGSVRGFAVGVFVRKASDNRVLGISSSKNLFFGFVIAESDHSLLRDSSGSGNLAPDGDGMGVFGSDHIRVVHNAFRNNPLGIHIDGSTDNLIKGNVITDSPNAMIVEADDNEVVRNRIARNTEGIILAGSANVIARNQFLKARGCGPGCGLAVTLEDGHDNLIARNIVRSPGELGIRLGTFGKGQRLRDNIVRRNSIHGASKTGVLIDSSAKDTQLKRNHVRRAGGDGIVVQSPATMLTRNHAWHNGGLGIDAVSGVSDGGGNEAGGNGNPDQCRNVLCTWR